MVSKTTSFEKGKGKKGYLMNGKPVAILVKKPKVEPKPRLSASIMWERSLKRNYPSYLVDEKAGKVDKSILDIHDL